VIIFWKRGPGGQRLPFATGPVSFSPGFVAQQSTATAVTSIGGRIDLRKWYDLPDRVRIFTNPKKYRQFAESNDPIPYLEPRRQRERSLKQAHEEISSYRTAQSEALKAIEMMAQQAEVDPVILGYRRMAENGTLAKLAKVSPVAHQALEREYAAKVAKAAELRSRQRQAEAMQI
jgi:hypothetical protein